MNNTNKKIAVIVALLLLVVLGAYAYNHRQAQAPVTYDRQTQQPTSTQSTAGQSTSVTPTGTQVSGKLNTVGNTGTPDHVVGGQFSSGDGTTDGLDIQVVEIDYTDSGFTPSTANIKVGDYIVFKNKSSKAFWPASNPHPTHTDYPGFDAKQSIAPGGKYQFQFQKAGNWGFHNHSNPSQGGTINVAK